MVKEVSRTWNSFQVHDVTLIRHKKNSVACEFENVQKTLVDASKPVINTWRGTQRTLAMDSLSCCVSSSLWRRHDSSHPHTLGLHVTQEHLGQLLVGSIPLLDPPNTVVVDTNVLIVARLSLRSLGKRQTV